MDILIESTSRFEQDLSSMSEGEKDIGVANRDDFNKAYQVVVESLYKDLLRQELEVVLAS